VLGLSVRARARSGFAVLTALLGAIAVVNGVDRWLWMLPWIPVPPTWIRILLELVWLPWALVVVLRRSPAAPASDEAAEDDLTEPEVTPSARP
jgi:hypothetical protein